LQKLRCAAERRVNSCNACRRQFQGALMNVFLYLAIYLSTLVFLIACVIRIFQYARTPLHLRWELYPSPHEAPGCSKLWAELKCMIPEILFLKSLREFNRRLWFRSFPFHLGLYFLIATIIMLAWSALLSLLAPFLMAGPIGLILHFLYTLTGSLGLGLGILGASSLLVHRLTDPVLEIYTARGDIFNLAFFIVTFGVLSAGYIVRPPAAPGMKAIALALIRFDTGIQIHALLAIGLFLNAILMAYIPMTHMAHFIAKYFTYHSVRWDDARNRRGGKIERRLAECLSYRPNWAAPHVKADGKRTWAEIAAINPAQEAKK
jgi:nitrate reductase gamma subunit